MESKTFENVKANLKKKLENGYASESVYTNINIYNIYICQNLIHKLIRVTIMLIMKFVASNFM